jgi:hypothetical protein
MSTKDHHRDEALPNSFAWASLLGLLSPSEYFVTIDHSVLWYRHVAWAKPKGEDLRTYVTQRFSSNMVVLSLMLAAQINVFFNSSVELTAMRHTLATEAYGDLKFWIGIVIALDACVTIMALVATFTLWGMISAISDTNSHALIRSSIGQYVISMPPRFVVAALYLFVCWMFLAFMDLMSGPSRIVLATVVLFLFFQVIVPLSAFGRLIIHTGAMAKRRVLEEDFEKELLPSGLHASLLIRAIGQRRKYSSAINQYKDKKKKKRADLRAMRDAYSERSLTQGRDKSQSIRSTGSTQQLSAAGTVSLSGHVGDEIDDTSTNYSREKQSFPADISYNGDSLHSLRTTQSDRISQRSKHIRTKSGDTAFPRASLLNSVAESSDLKEVVSRALVESEREHSVSLSELDLDILNLEEESKDASRTGRQKRSSIRPPKKRDSFRVITEWEQESSVRFIYDEAPPGIFVPDEEEDEDRNNVARKSARPRPSFFNRDWGLRSLANLMQKESIETPDSSLGEVEDLFQDEENFADQQAVDCTPNPLSAERHSVEMNSFDPEAVNGETQRLLNTTDPKTNRLYAGTH